MNGIDLHSEFGRMEREAFRLQQLQSCTGVPGPEWEAWQVGRLLPAIHRSHPFLKKVADLLRSSSGWPSTGIDWQFQGQRHDDQLTEYRHRIIQFDKLRMRYYG